VAPLCGAGRAVVGLEWLECCQKAGGFLDATIKDHLLQVGGGGDSTPFSDLSTLGFIRSIGFDECWVQHVGGC
jgi:hypothetical protein